MSNQREQRARVRPKRSAAGALGLIVALVALVLIIVMVLASRTPPPEATSLVAALNADGALSVREVPGGLERYRLENVADMALAPATGTLYACAGATIAAYDAPSGALRWSYATESALCTGTEFGGTWLYPAPGGVMVIGRGAGAGIELLWLDEESGERGSFQRTHLGQVSGPMALTEDRQVLVAQDERGWRILDLSAEEPVSVAVRALDTFAIEPGLLAGADGGATLLAVLGTNEPALARYDRSGLQIEARLDPERGAPERMAIAPDGAVVALAYADGLALLERESAATPLEIPLEQAVTALAFDPADQSLLAALADGQVQRFGPSGAVAGPALDVGAPVRELAPIALRALPEPMARPLSPPRERFMALAEPSEPEVFIHPSVDLSVTPGITFATPLLMTDTIGLITDRALLARLREPPGPLAWLQVATPGGATIMSVGEDGATTVFAEQVDAAIERRGLPPLLLRASTGAAEIVDTISGQRRELVGGVVQAPCVLRSDGAAVVCRAPEGLATFDLTSGRITTVRLLTAGIPVAWTPDGVYGVSINAGRRSLWRVDAVTVQQTTLFAIDETDRLTVVPQAGLVIFTRAGRELIGRDLATGEEQLLAASAGSLLGAWAVAPDGDAIAYVAINDDSMNTLVIQSLEAGVTVFHDLPWALLPGSIRWSPEGDAVVLRTIEPPDSPQRERVWFALRYEDTAPMTMAMPGQVMGAQAVSADLALILVYNGLQPEIYTLDRERWDRIAINLPLGLVRPRFLYEQ